MEHKIHAHDGYMRWSTKCSNLFLSELRQIFIKVANFWRTDGQNDKIMWSTFTFHPT